MIYINRIDNNNNIYFLIPFFLKEKATNKKERKKEKKKKKKKYNISNILTHFIEFHENVNLDHIYILKIMFISI